MLTYAVTLCLVCQLLTLYHRMSTREASYGPHQKPHTPLLVPQNAYRCLFSILSFLYPSKLGMKGKRLLSLLAQCEPIQKNKFTLNASNSVVFRMAGSSYGDLPSQFCRTEQMFWTDGIEGKAGIFKQLAAKTVRDIRLNYQNLRLVLWCNNDEIIIYRFFPLKSK